jgi:hypothetical protein
LIGFLLLKSAWNGTVKSFGKRFTNGQKEVNITTKKKGD